MKQLYYRVEDPNGLHIRPCIKLARFFKRYQCSAVVEYKDHIVSGKDAKALQRLLIPPEELVLFTMNGEQEQEVYERLQKVLEELSSQIYM